MSSQERHKQVVSEREAVLRRMKTFFEVKGKEWTPEVERQFKVTLGLSKAQSGA